MKAKFAKSLWIFTLVFALVLQTAQVSVIFADEVSDEEGGDDSGDEEEYIPDEYYEPVQSNDTEGWPEGQAIQASAGAVMDLDTGTFLYAKNIQRQLYPASITKILTALVALEHTNPDDVITCTSEVYNVEENASNIGLQEGEQITVIDALYALMLESAADAANMLAIQSAGSVDAFCDMMNQKAADLGCTSSHFTNPSGFTNEQHLTCARDMALIASAAYGNETLKTIMTTLEYEIKPTNMMEESRWLYNHHRMMQTDSDYYDSLVLGGKTGFTEAAWNTLVTYGEKDGMHLVVILLHGNGADQNYLETADLLNYGFDNFTHINVGPSNAAPILADAMDVHYLGNSADLQAAELLQKTADIMGNPMVTVPVGNDASSVLTASFKDKDGTNVLAGEYGTALNQIADNQPTQGSYYYTFEGWPVGCRSVSVSPVSLNLTVPWQVESTVTLKSDAEGETGDKQEVAEKVNQQVWQDVGNYVQNLDQKGQNFYVNNKTTIILVVGTIVIALLLLLLILMVRSTRNYRLRKKMREAEREAKRREKEIEEKTTAEIEQELREAMKTQGQEPGERP